MAKTKIFVEAIPLAKDRPSGIGHLLSSLLGALSQLPEFQERYELVLYAPHNMYRNINTSGMKDAQTRSLLYPAARVVNGLNYYGLLPPVDLLLGRGIYLFGNYANYPLTKRSRSVTWIHDLCFERFPETVSYKLQQHLHKHVPTWIKRADVVVAISEFGKQELEGFYGLPTSKVALVPGGIDRGLFYRRSEEEISAAHADYGLPKDYVLFVGNLEPRKNIEALVRAFKALPEALKLKYSLVLIGGDGWNNASIYAAIEAARQDGTNIIMPSQYVPDEALPAVISGAAFLAHLALYEGFGLTPLEALACRTDVLVSDIPPLHEVVGSYGDYCDPANEADILQALTNKFHTGSKVTSQTAEWVEQFSWEHSAERLLAVIESLSATI